MATFRIDTYESIRTAPGDEKNLSIQFDAIDFGVSPKYLSVICYVSLNQITGGASTDTVNIGRLDDIPANDGLLVNKVISIPIAPPESLAEEFAKSTVRGVPIHIRVSWYANAASAGFVGQATLDNALVLDRLCLPAIETFEVERATSTGTPSDDGVYLLTDLKLSCADTTGLSLKLHYAQDGTADTSSPYIDLTSSIPDLLTGVTDSVSLITQTFTNGSDFNFLLVFGDDYESASVKRSIFKDFANFHLSGCSTGGVCVGGFSTSTEGNPKFECKYPAEFDSTTVFDGKVTFNGGTNLTLPKDYSSGVEQNTGLTWIDGKTIYRYIWKGTVTLDGKQDTIFALPSTPSTVISLRGMIKRTDGAWVPSPNAYFSSSNHDTNLRTDGGKNVLMGMGSGFNGSKTVIVIVEYTK